jgi:hypothetical protein
VPAYHKIRKELEVRYNNNASKLGITESSEDTLTAMTHHLYTVSLREESDEHKDIMEYTDKEKRQLKEENSPYYQVCEFLVLTGLVSYLGAMDIDFDMRNRIDEKGKKFVFGYRGCFDSIKEMFSIHNRNDIARQVDDTIYTRLFSSESERDEGVTAYCSENNEHCIKDIELVAKLLKGRSEATTKIIEALKQNSKTRGIIQRYANETAKVYDELLGASFGLDEYVGMFLLNAEADNTSGLFAKKDSIVGFNESGILGNINSADCMADLSTPLREYFSKQFDISYERQFNKNLILKGAKSNSKPIYFPYKVMELIGKQGYTFDVRECVYSDDNKEKNRNVAAAVEEAKKSHKEASKEDINYYNRNVILYIKYLGSKFAEEFYIFATECILDDIDNIFSYNTSFANDLAQTIYFSDENKYSGLGLTYEDTQALLDDYKSLLDKADMQEKDRLIADLFTNENITSKGFAIGGDLVNYIGDKLTYLQSCMSLAVILTQLSTKNRDLIAFRIKVSSCGEILSNQQYCSQIAKTIQQNETAFDDCETMQVVRPVSGREIYIQDLGYTLDADREYGKPIFAYKALDKVKKQGNRLNWNNILLGKYADGRLCTSSEHDKVQLQNHCVHFLFAGSRSGKGVMCFNLFSTAVASGTPIFYCDRKPDTAVILKALARQYKDGENNGDMFAVNGGQYDVGIDLEQQFIPETVPYKIPEYAKSIFDDTLKADYLYFRAYLLMLCLMIFVDDTSCNRTPIGKKIRKELGDNPIFVLDEFTNFWRIFLNGTLKSKLLTPMATNASLDKWYDTYMKKGVIKAEKEVNRAEDEKKKATAQDKYESSIENALDLSLVNLYRRAIFKQSDDIINTIGTKLNSGASDYFKKQMNFFIIGQAFPDGFDKEIFFWKEEEDIGKTTGSFLSSSKKASLSPYLTLFNKWDRDIITGYYPSGKRSLGQDIKGSVASGMLTLSRRCFAYVDANDMTTDDNYAKVFDSKNAFKNTGEYTQFIDDRVTFFKPFLILNNGVDVPPELRDKKSVEKRIPIVDAEGNPVLDENGEPEVEIKIEGRGQGAEYQYVGQCLDNCARVGISYQEVLDDNHIEGNNGELLLEPRVGFQNYIESMCAGTDLDYKACLNKSSQIMNMLVQDILGYEGDWLDFLADFTPEAMFDVDTFIKSAQGLLPTKKDKVRNMLRESFFSPSLTKTSAGGVSFGSLYKSQLGSLAQYYDLGGSEDGSVLSDTESDNSEQMNFGTDRDMEETIDLSNLQTPKAQPKLESEPETEEDTEIYGEEQSVDDLVTQAVTETKPKVSNELSKEEMINIQALVITTVCDQMDTDAEQGIKYTKEQRLEWINNAVNLVYELVEQQKGGTN